MFKIGGTMLVMLVAAFFTWWYGPGWKHVMVSFGPRLKSVRESFSVDLLIPTLFAPWKQITSQPGRSLEDRFHAWVDNMFSRIIGFIVRAGVLFAALVAIIVIILVTIIEVIVWPLVPLAVPVLIFLGATA
jgi:hypothetical protein